MSAPKACSVSRTPVVLTASTRSQVASSSSSTGTLQPIPAFAQAMSTRPCARTHRVARPRPSRCARSRRGARRARRGPRRAARSQTASAAVAVDVAGDRAGALLAELARDRGADRATGSGDVRNLPIEQHRRARLPRVRTHRIREDLGRPRARERPALRRPAPRPRGHEPAGVRGAAAGRPHRAAARSHDRDGRPQRADLGLLAPDRGRHRAPAARRARAQRRGVRDPVLRDRAPAPGHRARDRPRAGHHAARHDDRLRRLAHLDARRVRRARVRHRHERGRARAGHADAAAEARAHACA